MAFKVTLRPERTMPRKCAGVLFQPGESVVYDSFEAIPERLRGEAESTGDRFWIIEEIAEKPKKKARTKAAPEPSAEE